MGWSSAWQKITCLMRELSLLWSWLKLMPSARAAVYSFTGNDTRPKVRWPFQTVLAMAITSELIDISRRSNIFNRRRSGGLNSRVARQVDKYQGHAVIRVPDC